MCLQKNYVFQKRRSGIGDTLNRFVTTVPSARKATIYTPDTHPDTSKCRVCADVSIACSQTNRPCASNTATWSGAGPSQAMSTASVAGLGLSTYRCTPFGADVCRSGDRYATSPNGRYVPQDTVTLNEQVALKPLLSTARRTIINVS